MKRNLAVISAIGIFCLLALTPLAAVGAGCPVKFDANDLQLGSTSEQLFKAKGPPAETYDKTGPSNWLLYNLDYEKAVMYGRPPYREGSFMVYKRHFYNLDAKHQVVGYSYNVSNRPYQLPLVKEALSWAEDFKWEQVHLIRTDMAPAILATATCGKLLLMVQADCYKHDVVDPKTYARRTVDPKIVGECRFRGLFIQLRDRSTPNAQVKLREYRFGS